MSSDERRSSHSQDDNESEKSSTSGGGSGAKSRILFPALSMLDVSNNEILAIPTNINELVNLSVLNLSENSRITELPPQMGLLYK